MTDLYHRRITRGRPDPSPRPSILVVDDEEDSCQNLADILADQDYEVDVAHSGRAAIELAQQRSYDVALLDLRMPEMDGVTLYRELRALRPEIVAIVVTAYATDPTITQALRSGAWQFLAKPIDLSRLLALLENAVQQPLILIVDDDEGLCSSLWDVLREHHLRVSLAYSESEAAQRLRQQDYDVVLVDLKLPGGDGRQLLKMLRNEHPSVRTILITGFIGEYRDEIAAALLGAADAVCCKPFDLPRLLETVDQLVRSSSGEVGG